MLISKLNCTSLQNSFKGISLSDNERTQTSKKRTNTKIYNKKINRHTLPDNYDAIILCGPEEVKKAKAIVAAHSFAAAGIAAAMAQAPGADKTALAANEIAMALEICNGVYDFKLTKGALTALGTAYAGNQLGTWLFKGLSKTVTWIPGPGNIINAGVASSTTALLGTGIIRTCEEIEKRKKQGEDMDKIIEAIKKAKKK